MSKKQEIVGQHRGDRQQPSGSRGGERPSFRGYINFKPSDSEKEAFHKWSENELEVVKAVARVIDSGWRISLTSDRNPGVYVGAVSVWASGHPSAGIILNTRAKEVHSAMWAVVWALEELFDYDLSTQPVASGAEVLF